ncbi:MAG: lysophospholipid acyltransferase family protein [Candidatus Omnitrophota bacterium]
MRVFVRINLKIFVNGLENLPKHTERGAIIVANHSSYLDIIVVAVAVFQNLINLSWVVSRNNYRLWCLKPLWLVFKPIAVNGTIEKANKDLSANRWIVIYPEGGKVWCPPREIKKRKPGKGAAIIGLTTGVPIIPVGITGADIVLPPRDFKYNPRHPIIVRIGKPFTFEKIEQERISEEILQEKTDFIMSKIEELKTRRIQSQTCL